MLRASTPSPVTTGIKANIESVAQLEQQFLQRRSRTQRLIDAISRFAGSVPFVAAHAAFFGAWIAANLLLPERLRFDPSLTHLHVGVALEALFLSAFVLMTQNRQGALVEHWAHVNLQVSLVTEQEIIKVLQLQQRICAHLGLHGASADHQLVQMVKGTDLGALVEEVGKARKEEEVLTEEAARARAEALVGTLDSRQPPPLSGAR